MDYLLLELRMFLNKDLLSNNVISFNIYDKMQNKLIKEMSKL